MTCRKPQRPWRPPEAAAESKRAPGGRRPAGFITHERPWQISGQQSPGAGPGGARPDFWIDPNAPRVLATAKHGGEVFVCGVPRPQRLLPPQSNRGSRTGRARRLPGYCETTFRNAS